MMSNNDLSPPDVFQPHNTTAATNNTTTATSTTASTQSILSIRTKSFFDPKVLAAVWYEHKLSDAWMVPVIVILGGIVLIVSVVLLLIVRWAVDRVCMSCHRVSCCCGPPLHRMDNEHSHLTGARHGDRDVKGTEVKRDHNSGMH